MLSTQRSFRLRHCIPVDALELSSSMLLARGIVLDPQRSNSNLAKPYINTAKRSSARPSRRKSAVARSEPILLEIQRLLGMGESRVPNWMSLLRNEVRSYR